MANSPCSHCTMDNSYGTPLVDTWQYHTPTAAWTLLNNMSNVWVSYDGTYNNAPQELHHTNCTILACIPPA